MNIPQELKALDQWVLWKYEHRDGKRTKFPYDVKTKGKLASTTNPRTWASFKAVMEAYDNGDGFNGIGFVFTENDPFFGVDLDKYIKDGVIEQKAQEIVDRFNSYTEITPSGTGLHIIGKGKLGDGIHKSKIELYDRGRYFTFTGNHIPNTPVEIRECQEALDGVIREIIPKLMASKVSIEIPGRSWLTDEQVIEQAGASKSGEKFKRLMAGDFSEYPSQSEADSALCTFLAFWCGKNTEQMDRIFRQSGLMRDKWDERHGAKTYGEMTIEGATGITTETYTPPSPPVSEQKILSDLISELEIRAWPVLNPKALYGIAGKVVELATRSSEADPAAILATFLVWFAAEVGAGPTMWVGDSKHYARIIAAVVGTTSKSRKGTSIKPIKRIFVHRGDDYSPARTSPGPLSSGEGIVYNVRDPQREWVVDKKTGLGCHTTTDPGVTDKRFCIIDEEFGSALSSTKREGNTLSTILRQAWDDGTIEPLTKQNRIKATNAHICIVTHITHAELLEKMHETEALSGFGNRILWVCARRQGLVPRPMPMPDDEVDALHRRIIEIVRSAQREDIEPMHFTEETWALWEKVYPELSKDHAGMAGVIINRAEAQVIRLAMIYALLDEEILIDPCHLEAALAFWQYCEDSAMFIFGGHERDAIADTIVSALQERDKSQTELYQRFQCNISSRKIKEALQDLITGGKATSYQKAHPQGRPTTMYTMIKATS